MPLTWNIPAEPTTGPRSAAHGLAAPPPDDDAYPDRPDAMAPGSDTSDTSDTPCNYLGGLFGHDWLMAQQFPPLEYVVPGMIPEGLTFLVAGPKIGKSWMVLMLAMACATGGVAFGRLPVERRPVLYLALEDGKRRLQDRIRRLGVEEPAPGLSFALRPPDKGTVLDTARQFVSEHANDKPLVIIDTLAKFKPPAWPKESDYEHDYRVGSLVKAITDEWPGSSIIVVHHARKAEAADFVNASNGTNGLTGAADTIAVLRRDRHATQGILEVTGRDVPEGRYAVQYDPDTGYWSLDGADLAEAASNAETIEVQAGLGDRSAQVLDALAKLGEATPAQLADALDMSNDDAGKYLRRLRDAGRVTSPRRGFYQSRRPTATPREVSEVSECPNESDAQPVAPPEGQSRQLPEPGTTGATVARPDEPDLFTPTSPLLCRVCGLPLDPVSVAEGHDTHPACDRSS
ncbi:MAG: AAA family ATPase [Propionibacteriaceae bacterium]|nr:AAA family ATPase [Propionibacteriaceae bacterium]